jgi:hypothetical protein
MQHISLCIIIRPVPFLNALCRPLDLWQPPRIREVVAEDTRGAEAEILRSILWPLYLQDCLRLIFSTFFSGKKKLTIQTKKKEMEE